MPKQILPDPETETKRLSSQAYASELEGAVEIETETQ
jgi:hypothetical protein